VVTLRSNDLRSVGGLWIGLLTLVCAPAAALDLQVTEVANGIYALVGPTGNRTYDNDAINANLGFIVTPEGVVLVDSGATVQSGPLIEQAIAAVTEQPIRWVVNLGSQDHRWLGNAYFAERGARIIALARTVETQRAYADSHLVRLRETLGDRLEGTVPLTAPEPIDETVERLAEAPDFEHLEHFEGWNRRNLNQT
jgi:glyoxylase-like metal-dependent hydrolase (beta-lactamase superfamily II)